MKQILAALTLAFCFFTIQTSLVLAQNTQDSVQHEVVFWESIRDKNASGYFDAYLRQYPDGAYASLAELKLERSKNRDVSVFSGINPFISTWLLVMIVSGFLAMAWVIHIPFVGWWDDWKKARKSC